MVKHDWTRDEIRAIYQSPLLELVFRAGTVHRQYHPPSEVQVCTIINVKVGGCPEDCKYCTQSARYQTATDAQPLMELEDVLQKAKESVASGVTRVCLGAAWRGVRPSPQFNRVLDMVKEITAMGAEVCCTLGMVQGPEAQKLKEAGLYAYNHNIDTSREHYPSIITTRTFDDRLQTLDTLEEAGISVCCGAILGLGESEEDRISLLHTLATRAKHPESVPLNRLYPIEGTPLGKQAMLSTWDLLRAIATARILMPKAMLRLSAGRMQMSLEQQALCFLAGANSIHAGEKLLTVANPSFDADEQLFELLGLTKRPAFAAEKKVEVGCC